jgi:hypothetical protein
MGGWIGKNGAQLSTSDAGARITNWESGSHPFIVPVALPDVGSNDYTVWANVDAPSDGEFGLIGRLRDEDGRAVMFGSKFAQPTGDRSPFLATASPFEQYNPQAPILQFAAYPNVHPASFWLALRVTGEKASGRIWPNRNDEPDWHVEPDWQGSITISWADGRGVGFYIYPAQASDMTLTQMFITVP